MQIQAKNGLVCCAVLAALMISTIAFYCGIEAAAQIGGEGNLNDNLQCGIDATIQTEEENANESFICDEDLIRINPYEYEQDD